MKDIFLIFLLINIQSYLFTKNDNIDTLLKENEILKINPRVSNTLSIKYFKKTKLNFENENENNKLQVNIHSINCKIDCNLESDSQGEIIYKREKNIYSIIINSTNENIIIEPELDKIDGEYIENYERKDCYLSINSYFLNDSQQNLKIENKEENIFYLNALNYNLKNISYEIKYISLDSFISLNFKFKESALRIFISFFINNIQINSLTKNINNNINFYLDSDFLLFNNISTDTNEQNGVLFINIINCNETDNIVHLKIIEKDSICLLEKNALNFGFLTTKTTYQYYYAEIFKDEEGELILHNKRFYGELYGKIITKNETNNALLNNTSFYPTSSWNDSLLEYNQHYLKLKYNYINTSHCFNGCYLLITYKRLPFKDDFPSTGYEFTILSRSWNYTDYFSHIIDIPYNEFIIGCFDQDTVQDQYYSIYIPNDAEKIIIELESNYLDFFYYKGRQRINTLKPKEKTTKLEIVDNKGVFDINVKKLNLTGNYISFVLKTSNYNTNIFSFYYFKVLYIKKNENIFYTLDSYLGNLCIPESKNDTDRYYCNFILNNNYKESNLKFLISSTNQNEYFKIYTTKVYTNGNKSKEENEISYIYNEIVKDIDYYEFEFEFLNKDIKNIIISFMDNVENVYPQIYSAQMYYIGNLTKITNFNIQNKYTLIYQYIYGKYGGVKFPNIDDEIVITKNYKGKPLSILIDKDTNMTINKAEIDFIYLYQLIYNDKNRGIEEIKLGEPKSQILDGVQFPIYFYLKLEKNNNVNIIANLILKANIETELDENIDINGYLLNENDISRFVNGDYIILKNQIEGYYSNGFDMGFIETANEYNENCSYLLIEIQKKLNPKLNSYILIDIVTKENNDNIYSIPINRYIFETFNGINNKIKTENKYHININQIGIGQVLIELSPQYDDIELKFENIKNFTFKNSSGLKKYRILNTDIHNVYFSVINPKNITANYMIRYYYTNYFAEYEYYFDEKLLNKEISFGDKNCSISLTYNSMKIKTGEQRNIEVKNGGISLLITGILYKRNDTSNEIINSACKLTEHVPFFTNATRHNYNYSNPENWTLIFENIPRNNNYIYDLKLKMNAILSQGGLEVGELLIFNTTIDLTEIKLKDSIELIYILVGVIGGILLIVAIFFIVKFIRLKKANLDLNEEIKSIMYSNDIVKSVLSKEERNTKLYDDYDSTFI